MKHHIMLVEDRPQDMRLTIRALKKAGYDVEIIKTLHGKEAIDYLIGPDKKPDLILLDWRLPIVSGEEVLDYIRSSDTLKKLPIIVLTTSDDPEDINLAYKKGCNAYLTKPVSSDKFDETIEVLGLFWLKYAILPKL